MNKSRVENDNSASFSLIKKLGFMFRDLAIVPCRVPYVCRITILKKAKKNTLSLNKIEYRELVLAVDRGAYVANRGVEVRIFELKSDGLSLHFDCLIRLAADA